MEGENVDSTDHLSPSSEKKCRESANSAASTRLRAAEAVLFPCAHHHRAVVLCTAAGKAAKKGRPAVMGGTVFWITCPHLNNVIARIERNGGVKAAAQVLSRQPTAMAKHFASHVRYTERVKTLLTAQQWDFFLAHFVEPEKGSSRLFGNAAVSHADDVKCLHAWVAQALARAANPIGEGIINLILFFHLLISDYRKGVDSDDNDASLKHYMDSPIPLYDFLTQAFSQDTKSEREIEFTIGNEPKRVSYSWISDPVVLEALQIDLCQRCLDVYLFLEGRSPRVSSKRRLN
ncbi:unnamed protein product [Phytomonas sp. Hart1]|nr:unnamed protein product [Phytomonas sp. Hart1]|eukprot:CCW66434.1 unnamed protein product [Phytomonas sp. isolate Hart1]